MAKLQSRVQTLTNLYLVAKTRRGILHFLSFYCPAKLYLLQPTELPAVTNHSEVCWLHAQYHVLVPAPWLGVLYLPATISFPLSVSRSLWFLPTNFFHFLLLNSECPWPFFSRLMPHSSLTHQSTNFCHCRTQTLCPIFPTANMACAWSNLGLVQHPRQASDCWCSTLTCPLNLGR